MKILFGVVLFAIAAKTPSNSQEHKSGRVAVHEQSETDWKVRCKNSGSCVAEELYTATVTDVLLSDTPTSHQVRLIVRFENMSGIPLILGYRSHTASVLDNFKNRFYCCASQSSPDFNAIGIGIDTGNKVDPQLLLQPHESANAIFELWRHRDNLQAASYDFDVMIDQIDPENKYRVLHNPYLSFRDLVPRARPQ
jgi:hypothetical protein